MTENQKKQVSQMRDSGLSYGCIARQLSLSENTVKSYCRRNGLKPTTAEEHCCLYCGKPVAQNPGRKEKKFCSDACRMKWWNSHPDRVTHRTERRVLCPNCGKAFTVYGGSPQKYCSHKCYAEYRFGGGA